MDQEQFQDIMYVNGDGRAMIQANLPQFKKIDPFRRTVLRSGESKNDIKSEPSLTDRIFHSILRKISHAPDLLRLF